MTESPFTIPPFAQACIDAAGNAWNASYQHPFILALAEGTLDSDIFKFYQMQDARYLEGFSDAAAIVSTRCVAPVDKLWFLDMARLGLVTEAELHAGYGKKLGYDAGDIAALELTPDNRAYQNHMISTAMRGTLAEGVAALVPCPWLYINLGQHILAELGGTIEDSHPYADWLRMYADPSFNAFMESLLERMQRFADETDRAGRARAKEAFVLSARYEYMFWDQAWTNQRWRT